jgi:hypothetical protein
MPRTVFFAVLSLGVLVTLPASAQKPAKAVVAPRTTANASATQARSWLMPGTRTSAFTTIQGNALTSTNGALQDSIVRLRDARSGHIVGVEMTDKLGLFAFPPVDPSIYVIEVVDTDQTVLAASQLLSVNAGDTVSAVVKLPWRKPRLGGILGHTMPSAVAVSSAAAAAGVMAAAVTGTEACNLSAVR